MIYCRLAAALSGRLLLLVGLAALLHGVASPTAYAQDAVIDIGTGSGRPGEAVDVTVSFRTTGAPPIAATVNDLTFAKRSMSLDPSDCRVNPLTGKSLATAILHDTRSSRTLRLYVQSIFSPPPIPDGPIYTCTFRIKPTALPGRNMLLVRTARGFGPSGEDVPRVAGEGGTVVVTIVVFPSVTPSRTPTATPTAPPTSTPSPLPTATPTLASEACPADLMLRPSAGPPGSQVEFAGRCDLVRDGRRAAVLFDDLRLANVAGNDIGTYSGVLEIPSDARLGTHLVRVVSPREIAVAPFEVTGPLPCAGDCDGNNAVGVDELLHSVTVVLGNAPLSTCESLDVDGDGNATINELLAVVQSALEGCAPPPG